MEFQNVTFAYDGTTDVLRGVSATIKPGEVIALVGPSGAGKTTLVNLIPRFYDVPEGRITVGGMDVRDVTMASLRQNGCRSSSARTTSSFPTSRTSTS